ncbi:MULTISPECIES: GntR family transcriptional regulator [Oceanobacillus]|uniref:GntR family transcriptional regulator n=1 Tax=Oceanobacillus kimchii TaxID=746691 RepID=A0ABQ5TGW5_9BACI|nr:MULTISPECIES: GntR family transcriptional regulator [Oceanobacillus]MBT2652895.1 GntR family transcriptional regulator [Oceanobacillus sp. ISL-73]OEH53640.1 GntR family transcriptional regulator [Oceanobacillus sp. E9]GLO64843.1 GntR family transcriptional regulator [Oceanobacillus kimchii]
MKLQFNKREPVYIQVKRHLKEQIATGRLKPGEEIPSRRELASQLEINPNTAQRAYKEMEEEGLIYTEKNLPSCVTSDTKKIEDIREELINGAIEHFLQAIEPIRLSKKEIIDRIKIQYDVTNRED